METKLLAANEESLAWGAELLRRGELVAFPHGDGLRAGRNALDSAAVREIFAAKGRPADNPLIVHIWDREQLAQVCHVPPLAEKLMDAFWPGPLTLLMPRRESIPLVVTASLPTVAVRMHSHPVAAALLKACNVPVAAPSANRSGKPSPTTGASRAGGHGWPDSPDSGRRRLRSGRGIHRAGHLRGDALHSAARWNYQGDAGNGAPTGGGGRQRSPSLGSQERRRFPLACAISTMHLQAR